MSTKELNHRLANFETIDSSGPVPEATIVAAEQQLGIQFPPQYRSFLSLFGCGGIDSEEFIGLGGPDHLNIVKLTLRLRAKINSLPIYLLPLRNDGFGNYDCFDTRGLTERGEFMIVQWNHEGGEDQYLEVLSDSFDQWFESLLVMIEQTNEDGRPAR